MSQNSKKTKFIAYSALFLALAVLLPIGFHAFGMGGRVFLPMHIPVFLAGFIAGPYAGLLVGLIAPGLSAVLTGMPPSYAVPLMSMELPMYGFIAGLCYYRMNINIYISLITAMLFGRIMFGLGLFLLGLFMDLPYDAATFFSTGGALLSGLPGLAVQFVLIPPIVVAVKRQRKKY